MIGDTKFDIAYKMQRFDSRSQMVKSDSAPSLEEGWRVYDDKTKPQQVLSRASHFSNDKYKARVLSQMGHRNNNNNHSIQS